MVVRWEQRVNSQYEHNFCELHLTSNYIAHNASVNIDLDTYNEAVISMLTRILDCYIGMGNLSFFPSTTFFLLQPFVSTSEQYDVISVTYLNV